MACILYHILEVYAKMSLIVAAFFSKITLPQTKVELSHILPHLILDGLSNFGCITQKAIKWVGT